MSKGTMTYQVSEAEGRPALQVDACHAENAAKQFVELMYLDQGADPQDIPADLVVTLGDETWEVAVDVEVDISIYCDAVKVGK